MILFCRIASSRLLLAPVSINGWYTFYYFFTKSKQERKKKKSVCNPFFDVMIIISNNHHPIMARKLKGKSVQAKGLKGALIRHQHSEKINLKTVKNVEISKQNKLDKLKSMKTSKLARKHNKAHQQGTNTKGLMPFNKYGNDKVLLIGEGDFSYAKSLVLQNFIQPENLIATSFDSFEELINKYENANEIIEELKNLGVTVMHEIDGTNLLKSLKLNPNKIKRGKHNDSNDVSKVKKLKLFKDYGNLNYIMFNFPHNGKGIKDVDRNIRDHQRLMLLFFKNCQQLFDVINSDTISGYNTSSSVNSSSFSSMGKIIISMFEGEPYHSWGIKILGKSQGWKVERSGKFDWSMFPEYHHRRTTSMKDTTKPASERDARMYIFEKFTKQDAAKRSKNGNGDDDSDSDD